MKPKIMNSEKDVPNLVGRDLETLEAVAASFWDALQYHHLTSPPHIVRSLKEAAKTSDLLVSEIRSLRDDLKEEERGVNDE